MTARAELYGEHTCSDCRGLVLHGDASAAPTCRRCERVVCSRCEVLGLCVACAVELYHPPFEALDLVHDEQLVVIDGTSWPGRRASLEADACPTWQGEADRTQPIDEGADDRGP